MPRRSRKDLDGKLAHLAYLLETRVVGQHDERDGLCVMADPWMAGYKVCFASQITDGGREYRDLIGGKSITDLFEKVEIACGLFEALSKIKERSEATREN